MIELILRIKGHDALYVSVRPRKNDGALIASIRTQTGNMKTLGTIEINDDGGESDVIRQIVGLLENQEYTQ